MAQIMQLVTVIVHIFGIKLANSFLCLDNDGFERDWWFIYKLPSGYLYSYFDDTTIDTELIVYLDTDLDEADSAAGRTLSQLLSNKYNYNFVAYNDEPPDGSSVSSSYGHTKGIMGYQSGSSDIHEGFWLSHSIPKYPNTTSDVYSYLPASNIYGQSMLCISINGFEQFDIISYQIRHLRPKIYDSNIMTNNENIENSNFSLLLENNFLNEYSISFIDSTLNYILHFGKSGKQGLDLYEDIVSPYLYESFIWETWRRSPSQEPFCAPEYKWQELNVNYIDIDDFQFKYTKDHSKIGIADIIYIAYDLPWVCVGDINRMWSQDDRGGGTSCFVNQQLWQALQWAFVTIDWCNYTAIGTDNQHVDPDNIDIGHVNPDHVNPDHVNPDNVNPDNVQQIEY